MLYACHQKAKRNFNSPSAQVQHGVSAPLDEVTSSVARNGICLKGVIAVPEVGYSGELQNLNQNFRTELDLYANVVKVS